MRLTVRLRSKRPLQRANDVEHGQAGRHLRRRVNVAARLEGLLIAVVSLEVV